MSSKALRYAEETLGVHQVWDEVQTRLTDLDVALSELDKAQDRRRELEEKHADREVLLVLEKRGVHPSMSDTRFKSELKIWEREDDMLRQLRSELMEIRSEIQGRTMCPIQMLKKPKLLDVEGVRQQEPYDIKGTKYADVTLCQRCFPGSNKGDLQNFLDRPTRG